MKVEKAKSVNYGYSKYLIEDIINIERGQIFTLENEQFLMYLVGEYYFLKLANPALLTERIDDFHFLSLKGVDSYSFNYYLDVTGYGDSDLVTVKYLQNGAEFFLSGKRVDVSKLDFN